MIWDDMALPDGWKIVNVGDVAEIVGGGTPKTTVPGNFTQDGGHPWLTPADLTDYTNKYISRGRRNLTDQGLKTSSAKYMPTGTVLFSSRAPIGYVAIASNPVTTNQGFRSFIPSELIDPEYLYYALKLSRSEAEQLASGTTFPELSGTKAKSLRIPLAPMEVQRALVRVLDESGSASSSATSHLNNARRAVARLRQSVLSAACAGRLTEKWRATRGSRLIDGEKDGELPVGWKLCSIAEVGSVQLGGTPSRKKSEYWGGRVPWVSSGEVANCRIAATRETITEDGLRNSSSKLYPPGTVLIAMIGEGKTRGQAAILDIEACTNQNAAGILPDRDQVDPEYLWRWALAQYEITRSAGRGGNQPALNKQKVGELEIAVPPLDEQREIVRRADAVLSLADRIASRIELAAKHLEGAGQAVLAKAFRGELVS